MIIRTLITSTFLLSALTGCGTNMPVQKTGKANEYVINRDDKSPFGSLSSVKAAVLADAAGFCGAMNKKLIEKYSIDKERSVFVWPETTLYFDCVDSNTTPTAAQAKQDGEVSRSSKFYEDLVKLDELRKRGVLTEAEFEAEKRKLLGSK